MVRKWIAWNASYSETRTEGRAGESTPHGSRDWRQSLLFTNSRRGQVICFVPYSAFANPEADCEQREGTKVCKISFTSPTYDQSCTSSTPDQRANSRLKLSMNNNIRPIHEINSEPESFPTHQLITTGYTVRDIRTIVRTLEYSAAEAPGNKVLSGSSTFYKQEADQSVYGLYQYARLLNLAYSGRGLGFECAPYYSSIGITQVYSLATTD